MSEFQPTSPEFYLYWAEENIRFADIDRLGHVNNTAFATYSESGRVIFMEDIYPGCTDGSGIGWVIAKLEINYLSAAYFPGKIKIGNVIQKIGNSSIVLKQGLFVNDKCFSVIDNILVWADTKNEKSLLLPEDLRAKLRAYHQTP